MTTTEDSPSTRNAPVWVTGVLVVVAAALVVVGVVYLTTKAGDLPSVFPGHVKANGHNAADLTHKHNKHAVAAFIVAALALVGAWMSAGRRTASAAAPPAPAS